MPPRKKSSSGVTGRELVTLEDAVQAADSGLFDQLARYEESRVEQYVSTGHPYVDYVFGSEMPSQLFPQGRPGGVILGRHIELFGPESSGKSTLATLIAIEVMKNRHGGTGRVAWIDAERCFSRQFFETLGGKPYHDKIAVVEPLNGQSALLGLAKMAHHKLVDLVVVDSVAALVPEEESVETILKASEKNAKIKARNDEDGEREKTSGGVMGGGRIGQHAQMMSKALRTLTAECAASGVGVIWINQIRTGMDKIRGAYEDTPGGRALKFYCSVRVQVRKCKSITIPKRNPFTGETEDETVAIQSNIKCVKNKTGIPNRQAVITFSLRRGYDLEHDALTCAIANGWIQQSGAWYEMGEFAELAGTAKVQGIAAVKQLVMANEPLKAAIIARVIDLAKAYEVPQDPTEAGVDPDPN